jgi:hypothetical protein
VSVNLTCKRTVIPKYQTVLNSPLIFCTSVLRFTEKLAEMLASTEKLAEKLVSTENVRFRYGPSRRSDAFDHQANMHVFSRKGN